MLPKVYFGMTGGELVIKARKENSSDTLQLIPHCKLTSDLPRVLIEKHVHWLDLSTKTIEVRTLTSLWKSSDNWCIYFARRSMTKGHSVLFDIRSPTWKMLSDLLRPLQDPQDLLVTRDNQSSIVSVDLPRYGLSFFINNDWELESSYPRSMVYDKDQSIGTLFGLVNKLVLRPKDSLAQGLVERQVLIPEGNVGYGMHGHHVKVIVDVKGPADRRILHKTFRIDTDLGNLAGNSGLAGNLYRAYLHALCSNPCSVDPLTGKTGTEEALTILRSGAVRSFLKFDGRAAKLLGCIASLTTEREWYPKHLKRMQNVGWRELPCASQHHNLYNACVSIKDFQKTLLNFHESRFSAFEGFPSRDEHLLSRIGLRAALLDPGDISNRDHDSIYAARDLLVATSDEARAYSVARAVFDWSSSRIPRMTNIYEFLESPGRLEGAEASTVSLRYSREWLFLEVRPIWLPLYNACRSTKYGQHRFQLLFTLAAMTYASPDLETVVHTLLAFATIPQFKKESPPSHATYCLSDGYEPSWSKLASCVGSNAVPYSDSPEESGQDYRQRLERDRGILWGQTMARWPCRSLPSFYFLSSSLYKCQALKSDVNQALESWYQNWELKQHLDHVQQILDQGYTASFEPSLYSFVPSSSNPHPPHRVYRHPTLEDLFRRQPPIAPSTLRLIADFTGSCSTGSGKLGQLIENFRGRRRNTFHEKYADDLQLSEDHLVHSDKSNFFPETLVQPVYLFEAYFNNCRSAYVQYLADLFGTFAPKTCSECAISESGQWPRITIKHLLGCLASNSNVSVSSGWRDYLISFAKLTLEYQRSRRLLLLANDGLHEDLRKEMENPGFIGWDAASHPDWILLQVDFFMMFRLYILT